MRSAPAHACSLLTVLSATVLWPAVCVPGARDELKEDTSLDVDEEGQTQPTGPHGKGRTI